MKLYLKKRFGIDDTIKENPPLSERGIRDARLFQLMMNSLSIDFCFTDLSIACFGSALLLVGDKVQIVRESRLIKQGSTEFIEKQLQSFLSFLEENFSHQTGLIIAEEEILNLILKFLPTAIFLS